MAVLDMVDDIEKVRGDGDGENSSCVSGPKSNKRRDSASDVEDIGDKNTTTASDYNTSIAMTLVRSSY